MSATNQSWSPCRQSPNAGATSRPTSRSTSRGTSMRLAAFAGPPPRLESRAESRSIHASSAR